MSYMAHFERPHFYSQLRPQAAREPATVHAGSKRGQQQRESTRGDGEVAAMEAAVATATAPAPAATATATAPAVAASAAGAAGGGQIEGAAGWRGLVGFTRMLLSDAVAPSIDSDWVR